jgi:CRP-like cAMP-binding protein
MRKVLYIMGQLNDEDVLWMAQAGRRLTLANGQEIIRQGVEAADLFIVLGGAVEVQVSGVGVVARLAKGEVLGEMSFVDRTPPSATVRAAGPATVLALDKQTMEGRLARDVGFSARFYKALAIYLADRLRETTAGKGGAGLKGDEIQEDELDTSVLDQVSMAGIRFEHMLKTLMGARAG